MHSVTALVFGGMIYLLFRSRTHIHDILHLSSNFYATQFFGDDFVKYALPDFLWAYSFSSALHTVLGGKKRKFVFFTVVLFGTAYEVAQGLSFIKGTGDIIDIIMYFVAAIMTDYIFFRKKERKK